MAGQARPGWIEPLATAGPWAAGRIAMDGDRATMKFRQIYKSDRLADDSRKTLVLAKQDGVWKITSERSE